MTLFDYVVRYELVRDDTSSRARLISHGPHMTTWNDDGGEGGSM